jgi:hypothetical protein
MSVDCHTGGDSRDDDAAEAYADLEFRDETESGQLLSGAPARVAVVKVLRVVSGGGARDATLAHMATGTSMVAIVECKDKTGNPNPSARVVGLSSSSIVLAAMAAPPPGIPEASRLSTQTWQNDLLELFHNAKDRFPDVVWELHPDRDPAATEEVWGHKGVLPVPPLAPLTLPSDRLRTCPALLPGALLLLPPSAHRVPVPVLPVPVPRPRAVRRLAHPHPRLQLALAVPVPRRVPLPVHQPGRHSPSPPADIPRPLRQRARVPLHGKGPRRGL